MTAAEPPRSALIGHKRKHGPGERDATRTRRGCERRREISWGICGMWRLWLWRLAGAGGGGEFEFDF